MKKHVFFFAGLFLLNLIGFSQNTANLVVFSEDGEPFFAYINGVKQNDKAETNVKFTGLSPNVSLRIEFENKALPQLKQSMALEPGFEHTARIKRDAKKQLKLRYFGQVPIDGSNSSNVPSVAYHSGETPAYNTASDNTSQTNTNYNNTSVTNSTTKTSSTSDNVSVNITAPGMNINVNSTDPNANTSVNTTNSTNASTNSSSSSTYYTNTETNNLPPANAAKACNVAMSATSFNKMKESVESKPFSETRMSTAKVATKNNCLSVNQVKEIAKLFSMDEDKLTYAKYAYDYCLDKGNYYQVSEVFSFSGTTDELNKFLEQ